VTEWTAPHDQKRNAEAVRMCVERGVARNLEIDYIDSRGRITPVEINATVMRLEGKTVILALCRDISARREAEKALRESTQVHRLMLSELDHRVRNNLASLAALIDISRGKPQSVAEFATSIRGRVQAMSAVHSMLSRARWVAVDLRVIVDTIVPYDAKPRVEMQGPEVLITPRQVTALGMMMQELVANSLKHGALKGDGRIHIRWSVRHESDEERRLDLHWRETGGSEIAAPPTPAQGTSLIQGFVRTELRGEANLSYPQFGADHSFVLRLDRVESR
jgi:two-component sensor histidine kinase